MFRRGVVRVCKQRQYNRVGVFSFGTTNNELILDGCSLSPEELVIAAADPKIVVKVADGNWKSVKACRDTTLGFAEGKNIVYGINTSCGSLVDRLLPKHELEEFQLNLIRCVATQVGEPFPENIVRAAMIDRVNSICRGASGISVDNLRVYLEMINKWVIPVIPQQGSLGASGDLGPLSCIALVAVGEWEAFYKGKRMKGHEALEAAGISPMKLGPKEGLAMINGTSCMAGLASHVVSDALTTLKTSHAIASLSMQGLKAHEGPFDYRAHEVKYHPGQSAVAANLRKLLDGSSLTINDLDFSKKLAEAYEKNQLSHVEVPIEDAYSIRAHPQYIGPSSELLSTAYEMIQRELNTTNDNPLVFPQEENFVHNANFM